MISFLSELRTSAVCCDLNWSTQHIPVIEPAKEVAGSRHAWRLKFGRIDRREGAILDVSAEISQDSDTLGLDGVVNLFLCLEE